ncbi:MAG: glycosyltransferase family 2 protein [Acetobacteraceae bacterium]|nr:MAG: glycosyltransferase family 2 protein [Acetobacteraceae bacterium]
MAADPSVSIIIPAYNAAAFVGDAIASALAQTQPGVEVIVVDDGSADTTWETVLAWAEADPRVVALRQPRQSGPSAARNAALDVARGRWVALLDADDLFAPDRLARMIRHAEETGADLLADDLLKCDFVTGTALGPCFGAQMKAWAGPLSLLDLVRGDMPDLRQGQHAKLGFLQPIMRREFLEQHRIRYAEDVTTSEDFLFYFECVARGARFLLLPEPLYVYRLRGGSVSNGGVAPLHVSRANRRMLDIARTVGDGALIALLRQRQRLLDFNSFALAIRRGWLGVALRHVQYGGPALLLRQLRLVAGAVRQQFSLVGSPR